MYQTKLMNKQMYICISPLLLLLLLLLAAPSCYVITSGGLICIIRMLTCKVLIKVKQVMFVMFGSVQFR